MPSYNPACRWSPTRRSMINTEVWLQQHHKVKTIMYLHVCYQYSTGYGNTTFVFPNIGDSDPCHIGDCIGGPIEWPGYQHQTQAPPLFIVKQLFGDSKRQHHHNPA